MSEIGEITILESGNIKITNRRAVLGTDSYAISNIIVARVTKEGSMVGCLVVSLISIGLLVGLFAIVSDTISETDYSRYLLTAAFICVSSALVVAVTAQPNYTIQISGPFGSLEVLQSGDKNYLESIVDAIQDAISYETNGRREELQKLSGNTQSP